LALRDVFPTRDRVRHGEHEQTATDQGDLMHLVTSLQCLEHELGL